MVNDIYNKINQKREIELINLNEIFAKEIVSTENEIKSYYEKNKEKYIEIYKSVKILEINPKKLIGEDEFNDLFFEKLDDIHDKVIQGKKVNSIIKEYNLRDADTFKINKLGQDPNYKTIDKIPVELINDIFLQTQDDLTLFIEKKDKYFIVEIYKSENVQKNLDNESVKNDLKKNLKLIKKRKLISKIISQTNQKSFSKLDFDKLSNEKNVSIKKITLKNLNDTKILKEQVINQIYSFPEKKIVVANNITLTENFLIYIDKVINVSINEDSEEYEKYFKLSKVSIMNGLFNTYDKYIKEKYEIDINYKALKSLKNYFN